MPSPVFISLLGLGAGPRTGAGPGRVTLPLPGSPVVYERPSLSLLLGFDGYRSRLFDEGADGEWHRDTVEFSVGGLYRRSAVLHHLFRSVRAGDVFAPLAINEDLSGERTRPFGTLLAAQGMRTGILSPEYLGPLTKNVGFYGEACEGRMGYDIWDPADDKSPAVQWTALYPLISNDADASYVYQHGVNLYNVDAPGVPVYTVDADPLAAGHPPAVQNIHGKIAYMDATKGVTFVKSGGAVVSREPMVEPDSAYSVSLGAPGSGGNFIAGQTYYIRIRWYDSSTGTYSGPDGRLVATTNFVTTAVGTEDITVDITALVPPSRATHWQVAIGTGDSPDQYVTAISLTDIGTKTAVLAEVPTTADTFPFLSVGGALVWRHSNWYITGARLSTHYLGRHIVADPEGTYVVFSEPDNHEHVYYDHTDPENGPASFDGESMLNSLTSPIRALGANEVGVHVFTHDQIAMAEGTFIMDADGLQRDVRCRAISVNNLGAVSPLVQTVDNDIFYWSPAGPSAITGGSAVPVSPTAVRRFVAGRDRTMDKFLSVAYDVSTRLVNFGFSTEDALGYNDRVLQYHIDRQGWNGLMTHYHTGLSSMYYNTGGTNYGHTVISGLPNGAMARWGLASGDGLNANDDVTEGLTALSVNIAAGEVTVSGTSWAANLYRGCNAIFVDPETKVAYEYHVIGNTTDTLEFNGALPAGADKDWTVYLGGVDRQLHVAVPSPEVSEINNLHLVMDDYPARYGI